MSEGSSRRYFEDGGVWHVCDGGYAAYVQGGGCRVSRVTAAGCDAEAEGHSYLLPTELPVGATLCPLCAEAIAQNNLAARVERIERELRRMEGLIDLDPRRTGQCSSCFRWWRIGALKNVAERYCTPSMECPECRGEEWDDE